MLRVELALACNELFGESGMPVFTITHRGVPVGTVDLNLDPVLPEATAVGRVDTLPGYAALGPAGRLVDGEFARGDTDETLRGVARALELRDVAGALVPTDFIELVECSPRPIDGGQRATFVGVFVRLRTAAAGVVAAALPRLGEPAESSPPAA